ncbi:hypothetical protein J3454_00450 [Erythrobacter sp. NFXS35]|uniref:hypothetical protein n=1 Tax=Erythrobacter sp. NFXS35 TaxID=2818436 RepID=UPI0032DE925D
MSSTPPAASTDTPSTQLTAAPDRASPAAPLAPAPAPAPAPAHLQTLAPAEPFGGLSREVQAHFLTALSQWGNVRAAAAQAGVSRAHCYRMRRASGEFRELWDAALVLARPQVEEVLADRALNGVTESVFYHGEEVATRTRYDARLLLAHLARLDRLESRCGVNRAGQEFDARIDRLLNPPVIEDWDEDDDADDYGEDDDLYADDFDADDGDEDDDGEDDYADDDPGDASD